MGAAAAEPDFAVPASAVVAGLASDPQRGLDPGQAAARLAEHGPNELEREQPVSVVALLLAQLRSPMILLLAAAGMLSAALGDVPEAAVIAVVVVLNAWIGFTQEYRAEQAMAALQAMAAPVVTAVRGGAPQSVAVREVVPGDLVELEAGSRVPADGRLLEAHALRVDESALTGESAPVTKATEPVGAGAPLAERTPMAFAGTSVAAGRGRMIVTATGMDAELGQVAGMLAGAAGGPSPLRRRLDLLVRRLGLAAGAIVLVVLAIGLLRGEETDTLLLTAISLAVAAIPESLPAVVTVTLALGAQRMLRRSALIRRLDAVETLGSVTTICSDKTGTLTLNRMTVVVLDMAGDRRELADAPAGALGRDELRHQPTLRRLLAGGTLCNDVSRTADGELTGDPTETALVAVAQRYGLDRAQLEAVTPRVAELPFDSERKRMTTLHALPSDLGEVPAALLEAFEITEPAPRGGRVSFTKGAPESVLACCASVEIGGEVVPLDAELRARALAAAERLAGEGVRVLAVAMRLWPARVGEDEGLERGLTLLGLAGMIDPARPEVRTAIETCRTAGVRPVMITGDHPLTAAAIARDLELLGESGRVVSGAELETASDLSRTVAEASVYARVSPRDKLRIVEALQGRGEVVAMTGDGVNDAPAIKQAEIGVAMGITGTDVTKEAGDMVLQDDNFATIVGAVAEGRVVFDNIRKFIRNILSGNVAEVSVMVLAPLTGMPVPLLPLQILWLNLVTDGLPAMAMAVEPAEPDVMRRPPTPLGESLLGADRGRRILARGAVLTLLVGVPAFLLWDAGDAAWQSVLFTSIALAELAGSFAMRSERLSLPRLGVLGNRALVGAVVLTVALQGLVIAVPFVRDLLGLEPLGAAHWLLCGAIALAYLAAVEADKAWRRRRRG